MCLYLVQLGYCRCVFEKAKKDYSGISQNYIVQVFDTTLQLVDYKSRLTLDYICIEIGDLVYDILSEYEVPEIEVIGSSYTYKGLKIIEFSVGETKANVSYRDFAILPNFQS